MMRTRLWIVLWLFGILFPVAFLGSLWPSFGRVFDAVFSPGWMHVLMHAFLFSVLAWMLAEWWIKPLSIKSVLSIAGLAMLIGCSQEGLQALASGSWPGWSAVAFDLAVDGGGAALGLVLAWLWTLLKHRSRVARHRTGADENGRNGRPQASKE